MLPTSPFFIIGNPRSGTTLLRLMCHAHPDTIVPQECAFAAWFAKDYGDWSTASYQNGQAEAFFEAMQSAYKWELWQMPPKTLHEAIFSVQHASYPAVVDAIYHAYAAMHGRTITRWGDKNNYYLSQIPTLQRLFPGAQFVHIIRDGRSVGCDYRGVMASQIDSMYAPKLPTTIEGIATEWGQNIKTVEAAFADLPAAQCHTIRYEDIVLRPEATLRTLCEFLHLPWSDQMLRYWAIDADSGKEPAEFKQWKAMNDKPLQPSETRRHLAELTPAEITEFETHCGDILTRYDYPLGGAVS